MRAGGRAGVLASVPALSANRGDVGDSLPRSRFGSHTGLGHLMERCMAAEARARPTAAAVCVALEGLALSAAAATMPLHGPVAVTAGECTGR